MTEHPHRLAREAGNAGSVRLRHPLEQLDASRVARSLSIYRPDDATIEWLCELARRNLPQSAPADIVKRVVAQNPDAIWAIARKAASGDAPFPAEGFIATLPISQLGLSQLVANTFNGADPEPAAIAAAREKPAAIYIWAAYAPGRLIAAVPLVFEQLSTPLYQDADLIARAATAEGRRLSEVLGLKRGALIDGVRVDHLYVFERSHTAKSGAPTYDSYRPGLGPRALSVTLARTYDDVARAMCVRAAVYMAEQDCPYDEEFDGNDFTATHLIGYVGSEPAGCARIRYFASFAKIERMAVRKQFRHTRLVFQLAQASIEFCRKKGYAKLYCHAQKRLVPLWKRFGFQPIEGAQDVIFSDFDYVEMAADVGEDTDAVAIGTDPYVTIRPEGQWHLPGILERSAVRGATRPSVSEVG